VHEQLIDRSVLLDPFDGGLLTDLVDADEVVAGLADERGDLRILVRLDAVTLAHRGRVVDLELRDAAHIRIQQRDIVIDELDAVAVSRDDEHPESLGRPLGGQSGQDVVRLDILFGDGGDVHGVQGLFEQRDLPDELGRGLAAGALVLRVFAGAERVAGDIEGHSDVRGLLLREQVDEHRDEAVDGVGVLSVAGDETVDREGVEGPESQRMAVDDEEGRLFGV